jgi:hypothetical protein
VPSCPLAPADKFSESRPHVCWWHKGEAFGAAAITSGICGASAVPARPSAQVFLTRMHSSAPLCDKQQKEAKAERSNRGYPGTEV